MVEVDEDFVRKRVEEGNSHAVISEELQTMFPDFGDLSNDLFDVSVHTRGSP